jgi:sugar phosphate isomerase/epimerase
MPDATATGPITLGVQLYTLRDLAGSFDDLLRVVAEAGYDAVETVGRHGLDAATMRSALQRHGLRAVSTHLPLATLRDEVDATSAFAREVGIEQLVIPSIPGPERPVDGDGWRRLGERLAHLGACYREHGLRLAFHNHDGELAPVDGGTALDAMLESGDPDDLDVQLDLAWIARAGADPLATLERHGPRCRSLHVKDLARPGEHAGEDGWTAVGQGTLDWHRLLPAAKRAGVRALLVEHDRPADPVAVVLESHAFLAPRVAGR